MMIRHQIVIQILGDLRGKCSLLWTHVSHYMQNMHMLVPKIVIENPILLKHNMHMALKKLMLSNFCHMILMKSMLLWIHNLMASLYILTIMNIWPQLLLIKHKNM